MPLGAIAGGWAPPPSGRGAAVVVVGDADGNPCDPMADVGRLEPAPPQLHGKASDQEERGPREGTDPLEYKGVAAPPPPPGIVANLENLRKIRTVQKFPFIGSFHYETLVR